MTRLSVRRDAKAVCLLVATNAKTLQAYLLPFLIGVMMGLDQAGHFIFVATLANILAPLLCLGMNFQALKDVEYGGRGGASVMGLLLVGGVSILILASSLLLGFSSSPFWLVGMLACGRAALACIESFLIVTEQRKLMMSMAIFTLSCVMTLAGVTDAVGLSLAKLVTFLVVIEVGIALATLCSSDSRSALASILHSENYKGPKVKYGVVLGLSGALGAVTASGERALMLPLVGHEAVAIYTFTYMLCFAPARILLPGLLLHLQHGVFLARSVAPVGGLKLAIASFTALWAGALWIISYVVERRVLRLEAVLDPQLCFFLVCAAGCYVLLQLEMVEHKLKFSATRFIVLSACPAITLATTAACLVEAWGLLGGAISSILSFAVGLAVSFAMKSFGP